MRIAKLVLLVVIFQLGRLHDTLSPFEYVWLLTGSGGAVRRARTREPDREPLEA